MEDIRTAKRNARLTLGGNFLHDLAFILPIWLLYSVNELGLSPGIATVLFMCIWLTGGLLEVPTGALADRFGRKRVFILGNLLLSIYPFAYALESPLIVLVPICFISGLGQALQSGSLLPLVHKSYQKAGFKQKTYNVFLSNSHVAMFLARALSGVAGAVLYSMNPKLPFIAMGLVTLLNVGLGFLLHDEKITEKTATNREHIIRTVAIMRRSEVIFSLLVTFVLFNLVSEAVWTGYQLFYEADGQSAVVIGSLFSIIALCSAVGAYAIRHAFGRVHPLRVLHIGAFGVFLTTALLYQPLVPVRLLAIFPMGFMSGAIFAVLNATTQHLVANRFHSTALSVINLAWYGAYGVGSIGVGVLFNLFGVSSTRGILLAGTVFIGIPLWLYARTLSGEAKAYRIQAATLE